MAAVFQVRFDYGGSDGSPSVAGITSVVFKAADDWTEDDTNAIEIPVSGQAYSFWKHIYLRCTSAPDTSVDNIKLFSDSNNNWTAGIGLYIGTETPNKTFASSSGYVKALGVVGSSGTSMLDGHSGITGRIGFFATYGEFSGKNIPIAESGGIINSIGECCCYAVFQANLSSSVSPGKTSDEIITFRYDEI